MPIQYYNLYSPASANYMESQAKRDRTWVNTPGYPLADRSALPQNPYSDYHLTGTSPRAQYTVVNNFGTPVVRTLYHEWPKHESTLEGFYSSQSTISRSDESMFNEALVKALVKAADGKANLALLMAEKKKTSDMIYANARKVYDAYRFFRRGDFKNAAWTLGIETPHKAYKGWLEYQYGVMPILLETKGIAELVAQKYGYERPARFTVWGSVKHKARFYQSGLGRNRMGFESNLETETYDFTRNKECKVKLECEISHPLQANLRQLGLTDPLTVAWELVPYSFVFDWFIQVGDWLQARTALHGLRVRSAMVSHLLTVDGYAMEVFPGVKGYYDTYSGWVFRRDVKIRHYRRNPFDVLEVQTFPPFDDSPLHWKRKVSGIALMASQVGKWSNDLDSSYKNRKKK